MLADRIIDEARNWLGTPYRHGGNGPKVFDCTGFTKFIFKKFGYELGRTVPAQAGDGRELIGNLSDLQKGDILIFASRPNKRKMGHAAIFIGLDSTGTNFNFIHAARTGVIISNLKETYYKERFLGARRILPDFVSVGQADSAAVASLVEMLTHTVAVPDTLSLSPADRRVILFADGTWAMIGDKGEYVAPPGDRDFILNADATWRADEATTAEFYTVKSGDTLAKIARQFNISIESLREMNGLTPRSVIRLGDRLRVQ